MRVDGQYALDFMRPHRIHGRQRQDWPSKAIYEFKALIEVMPAAVNRVGSNLLEQGAPSAFLDRMAKGIRAYCATWASRLDAR